MRLRRERGQEDRRLKRMCRLYPQDPFAVRLLMEVYFAQELWDKALALARGLAREHVGLDHQRCAGEMLSEHGLERESRAGLERVQ